MPAYTHTAWLGQKNTLTSEYASVLQLSLPVILRKWYWQLYLSVLYFIQLYFKTVKSWRKWVFYSVSEAGGKFVNHRKISEGWSCLVSLMLQSCWYSGHFPSQTLFSALLLFSMSFFFLSFSTLLCLAVHTPQSTAQSPSSSCLMDGGCLYQRRREAVMCKSS